MTPNKMLAALTLTLGSLSAPAADLMTIWQAARQQDPQGRVLEAAREAGAARLGQASALWQPTVGLQATAGLGGADSRLQGAEFSAPGMPLTRDAAFATSVQAGALLRWNLAVSQPLHGAERRAQTRQLELSAQAASLEWDAGLQDWMLLTAQRYFDLVLADHRLTLLLRQQTAVERALVEARDRYALGDIPITDTHEATARARQLQAQVLAAQHERDLARSLLSESTGLSPAQLALQAPAASQPPIPTESLEHWQNLARQQDHRVRQMKLQAQAAEAETRKFQARDSATVDLVAQASGEHLAGTGDFGSASSAQWQRMVGISVTVPLWTGGWRQSKLQESVKQLERAEAEVERAQQSAGQSARTAWLGLHSGLARLDALRLALTASAARLDATQLGRQLGDRTTMDLLNAENDLGAAELALLQVRVELLMSRLRLAAAAGQLDEAQLRVVNASLQP